MKQNSDSPQVCWRGMRMETAVRSLEMSSSRSPSHTRSPLASLRFPSNESALLGQVKSVHDRWFLLSLKLTDELEDSHLQQCLTVIPCSGGRCHEFFLLLLLRIRLLSACSRR